MYIEEIRMMVGQVIGLFYAKLWICWLASGILAFGAGFLTNAMFLHINITQEEVK